MQAPLAFPVDPWHNVTILLAFPRAAEQVLTMQDTWQEGETYAYATFLSLRRTVTIIVIMMNAWQNRINQSKGAGRVLACHHSFTFFSSIPCSRLEAAMACRCSLASVSTFCFSTLT